MKLDTSSTLGFLFCNAICLSCLFKRQALDGTCVKCLFYNRANSDWKIGASTLVALLFRFFQRVQYYIRETIIMIIAFLRISAIWWIMSPRSTFWSEPNCNESLILHNLYSNFVKRWTTFKNESARGMVNTFITPPVPLSAHTYQVGSEELC